MLKAGIIGCGGITERRHGPVLARLHDHVKVTALADLSAERTNLLGEKLGVDRAHQYQDWEAMLRNEELDLVHICTPHNAHEAQSIAAMQAGAHVLMEKPISTTVEEANRILAVAKETGRKLTISHNQRFSPAALRAQQDVENGTIGKAFLVRTEGLGRSHVVGRGINQDWRTSASIGGGGPLIDNGYHQIYRAVAWLGSPVKQVYAHIGRHVHNIEVEDLALVLLEHESGATTSVQVGWCAPGGSVRMEEIFGSRGQMRIAFGAENPYSIWTDEKPEWTSPSVDQEGPDDLGFSTLVKRFIHAIENDGPVPVAGEESRHTLAVVLAAYESGKSGKPIPVTE